MKAYWSEKARKITPYVAGEQPKIKDIIKLNTNENPYPPSPKARAVLKNFQSADLRLYPDPECDVLREAVSQVYKVPKENVFCANGSDEVLAMAFQAFFDRTSGLRMPEISYSFYPVWADMFDIPYETVAMNHDFSIPAERFYGGAAVFPNPNAPTGMTLSLDEIEQIVKNAKGVVIVDEAYVEFGAETAIPLTRKYENLLVVRTLSKSHALAGLRVGFAVGAQNLIEALRCIRDSYNSYPVDSIAANMAAEAILDTAYTKEITEAVMRDREWFSAKLENLGFTVLPSKANFVFCKHASISAEELMRNLKKEGVIVRWFNKPVLKDYLRITIGNKMQLNKLIENIENMNK